jgi:hypothetical protein
LASEYGWTHDYILDCVYPDELLLLTDRIHKRQLDAMIAQLRITTNPHLKPDEANELAEELMSQRRRLHGFVDMDAQLDKEGLEALKDSLKKSSKSIRVK